MPFTQMGPNWRGVPYANLFGTSLHRPGIHNVVTRDNPLMQTNTRGGVGAHVFTSKLDVTRTPFLKPTILENQRKPLILDRGAAFGSVQTPAQSSIDSAILSQSRRAGIPSRLQTEIKKTFGRDAWQAIGPAPGAPRNETLGYNDIDTFAEEVANTQFPGDRLTAKMSRQSARAASLEQRSSGKKKTGAGGRRRMSKKQLNRLKSLVFPAMKKLLKARKSR